MKQKCFREDLKELIMQIKLLKITIIYIIIYIYLYNNINNNKKLLNSTNEISFFKNRNFTEIIYIYIELIELF